MVRDSFRKVIIIEDDRDINNLIAYNLRQEGYCVEQFFDGTSGLQRLNLRTCEIVVLDIMLPGIDGFEICRKIKGEAANPFTFVIVVSAKNSEHDKLYAYLLGASYYLPKPFNLASLIAVVNEASQNLSRNFFIKLN